MRNRFFDLLKEEMRKNDSIFLVVADMGLGLVEPIQKVFPERFINVGIAEQNMIGIAAGLCNLGFRPFCYTISNFLIQRCFEQIRNDICLHNHPITLVGASTGYDNGLLGPTHQVIDDIGCVKVLPNINIYSPATVDSIDPIFHEIIKKETPAYIRIGKGGYKFNNKENSINFLAKKSDNSDVLVVTHGTVFENCVRASEIRNNFPIYCMNRVKPINKEEMAKILKNYSKIIVIEDHLGTSGLYNSLCMSLNEMDLKDIKLASIAPPENYEKIVGDKNYFAEKYGFSPEKIAENISKISSN